MLARINAEKDRLFLAGIIAGTLSFAPGALALGLGELMLESSLNEPLDATVELIDTAGLDEGQIVVELGSAEDFERAGVDRPQFLNNISFDVELSGNTGTVRLTTRDSVTEPFINLIVSARWPNGRLQREYTVLVDLPVYSDAPLSQADLPTAENAGAETGAVSTGSTEGEPALQNSTEQTAADAALQDSTDQVYTVAPGDSLWEIAQETRPDDSVSVQQTMLAIQRANQEAFVNNNINRVITGRVLRIPTLQEIRVVDQNIAVTQIGLQNSQLGVQPLAGAGNNQRTGALQDELSVLTNDPQASNDDNGDLLATIAALENELLISEENLDRARLENQELNARLSSLEEEIDLLENLVALEDQRIAQLQAELASQSAATAAALAEAQQAVDALNALDNEPAPQGLLARILAVLQNNIVWAAIMVALVLAVAGLLIVKSRRDEEQAEAYAFDPVMPADADMDDPADDEAVPAKPGMLAAMMARLRGNRRDRDEDDILEHNIDEYGLPADAQGLPASNIHDGVESLENIGTAGGQDYDDLPGDLELGVTMGSKGQVSDALSANDEADYSNDKLAMPSEDITADAAVTADSDDMAAAAAAIAAMEADENREIADPLLAQQESERDADVFSPSGNDPAIEAIAFTPYANQADRENRDERSVPDNVTAIADSNDDTEVFEFTLRDANDGNDDDTPPGRAVFDEDVHAGDIEKFDFRLQDSHTSTQQSYTADFPMADQDAMPDLADLSFDDSMLADDDEQADYLSGNDLDECDTKLDLATAYEAMGDVDDAIEILNEVIAEGNQTQIETAERLKQSWQSA